MRICQVCGLPYAGYHCPCRRKRRRAALRSTGSGGGRRWRFAQREARILGRLPVDTAASPSANVPQLEHAGAEQWYVCPRCDAVFTGERCPACWERWQEEMADAGDPGAFRIVEDPAATRCVLPVPGARPAGDFCPES